jgi:membrane-associated phospholipid phosphatase
VIRPAPSIRLVAAAASVTLALVARAEEPSLRPRYDLVLDGAVTGAAAATTLTLFALQDHIAPRRCRWCEPPRADADAQRSLRWSHPQTASHLSDGLSVALAGGALGYGVLQGYRRGDPEAGWADALLVTEATSLALVVDTGLKYAVARQRPDAWREDGASSRKGGDRNLSFPSMHATFAFAVAASSTELLRSQDDPNTVPYALVAFGTAATVGYLRVSADKHFPTDVLAGAAIGTAIGWAIPHFFHPRAAGGLRLAAAPGGIAITW